MKMDGGGNLVFILVIMIFGLGLAGVGFGQFPLAGTTIPGLPTTLGDATQVPGIKAQSKSEIPLSQSPTSYLSVPIGKKAVYEDAKIKATKNTPFIVVQSSPSSVNNDPLGHALTLNFSRKLYYFPCAFRWPAVSTNDCKPSDFGGVNPNFSAGSLFALSPDFDITRLKTPEAKRLATALQTYGAYAGPGIPKDVWQLTVESIPEGIVSLDSYTSNYGKDIKDIFEHLKIITNNSATSIGGGS